MKVSFLTLIVVMYRGFMEKKLLTDELTNGGNVFLEDRNNVL